MVVVEEVEEEDEDEEGVEDEGADEAQGYAEPPLETRV